MRRRGWRRRWEEEENEEEEEEDEEVEVTAAGRPPRPKMADDATPTMSITPFFSADRPLPDPLPLPATPPRITGTPSSSFIARPHSRLS